jgi:hypothetical protein
VIEILMFAWSIRLSDQKPGPVGANVDPAGLAPGVAGTPGVAVMDATADGDATAGIAGKAGAGPTKPPIGDTVGVGTVAAALTPRLPISNDPSGIPVRAAPPGVVGEVDVGADDAATLLEPEPHIPDIPAVSIIPELVDTPDVLRSAEELDTPDDIAPPAVPAVAGPPVPAPPPSKLAVEPNIADGEVPTVEHTVPPPVFCAAIVPVTPVGTGLIPAVVISVEPSAIPVGPTDVPGPAPSGEVELSVGVVGIAPTCATAALHARSAGNIAAINVNFMVVLLLKTRRRGVDCMARVFAQALPGSSCNKGLVGIQFAQLNSRSSPMRSDF